MVPFLFEPFFATRFRTHREAVSLARLVKAEIVSPYHGISINAGMGNPTSAINRGAWKNKRFREASGEAHIHIAFIKGAEISHLHPCLLLPSLIRSRTLELQRPSSHLVRKTAACPEREACG